MAEEKQRFWKRSVPLKYTAPFVLVGIAGIIAPALLPRIYSLGKEATPENRPHVETVASFDPAKRPCAAYSNEVLLEARNPFPDGRVYATARCDEGRLEGAVRLELNDGSTREQRYVLDRLHGPELLFDPDGNLAKVNIYNNGTWLNSTRFFPDGRATVDVKSR